MSEDDNAARRVPISLPTRGAALSSPDAVLLRISPHGFHVPRQVSATRSVPPTPPDIFTPASSAPASSASSRNGISSSPSLQSAKLPSAHPAPLRRPTRRTSTTPAPKRLDHARSPLPVTDVSPAAPDARASTKGPTTRLAQRRRRRGPHPSANTMTHDRLITNQKVSKLRPSSPSPVDSELNWEVKPDFIATPESLARDLKSIYGELVVAESKCIEFNRDAQCNDEQHKDKLAPIGFERLRERTGLQRTVLYHQYDFMTVTHHPCATDALRALVSKYSMPARLWRHGIHDYLELLRRHKSESQEFMVPYIYLSYQVITALSESVPSFRDTWNECLGDLARYRMAVEEDRETHTIWGTIAVRWYTIASDDHSDTGRLYHHLGILERSTLRKISLYTKSIVCSTPFLKARESLQELSVQIIRGTKITVYESNLPAGFVRTAPPKGVADTVIPVEEGFVAFHTLLYSGHGSDQIERIMENVISQLAQPQCTLGTVAIPLALTSINAVVGYGSADNELHRLFLAAIEMSSQARTAAAELPSKAPATGETTAIEQASESTPLPAHIDLPQTRTLASIFCFRSFNSVLRGYSDTKSLHQNLPLPHLVLVFLKNLHSLHTRLAQSEVVSAFWTLAKLISWDRLMNLLNSILRMYGPIEPYLFEAARQGLFPSVGAPNDRRPFADDFYLRGHVWCSFLFPVDWFSQQEPDDGRFIETPATQLARVHRVIWLGLYFSFHSNFILYDNRSATFVTPDLDSDDTMDSPMDDADSP